MKSRQLLSVVFSLIMFTGVTASSLAFAESDDLDDILEDYCEMTIQERADVISNYELDEYANNLAIICEMEDEDEREDSLEDFIDAIDFESRDIEDESDDIIEDFEDCVEAGHPVMESFPEQCMIDDGRVYTNTEDDDNDDRQKIDDGGLTYTNTEDDDDRNEIDDDRHEIDDYDLDDLLDRYCEMTDEEQRQLLADHPRLEPFNERLANYCDLSEDEQDAIDELIEEHEDKIRHQLREYADEYHMNSDIEMREHLTRYCEMSDADKKAFIAENDKAEDHVDKMNRYCELDEDDRANFIEEHRDEYIAHMKEKMMDKKHHMDYDRLCALDESDRKAEIDDSEKLDRLSKWCEMTPEEREDYKKEHHYAKDDKKHDFDGMSDMAKDRMSDVAKDKLHENKMKMSDKSDRIKAMIMDKRDISDERRDEIKMKYIEKHGDLTDEKKSKLKMKFEDHMKTMKHKISDERKSDIHDRLAEMKAFKAELRERSSELTDEEKQQFRENFIEKAKDMQLAWISPRTQMTAGIDAADVECREGFSLVMKASNGVAMCLKADTALKMIDRGIVVPAI